MASNPMNDWSYSGSPSSSSTDAVRFLIGDTNSEEKRMTNSEIKFLVSTFGDIYSAGAVAADSLAAKYAGDVDYQVGEVAEKSSQKAIAYRALAQRLRQLGYSYSTVLPAMGHASDLESIFTIKQFDDNNSGTLDGREPGSDT